MDQRDSSTPNEDRGIGASWEEGGLAKKGAC